MKKLLLFLFVIALQPAFAQSRKIPITAEQLEALKYLNAIRQNPDAFSDEIGVDLSYVQPKHPLRWNHKLYKAALYKAKDMAKRDYFAHIDPDGYGINYFIDEAGYELEESWLEEKSMNYFESLCLNYSPSLIEAIDIWIIDPENDPPGHRNHILAISDFWADCVDFAIAKATRGKKTYFCCLLAKHKYYSGEDLDCEEDYSIYEIIK